MSLGIAPFVATMLLAAASVISAQDSHVPPDHQQIPSPGCLITKRAWEGGSKPCTQDEHDAWLADIRHWRDERLIRVGYDGSRYDLPALKWTQSSFFQPQMMVEDRYFYDPVAHRYTVDRFRRRGLSVCSRRGGNPGSDNGRDGKSSSMQSSSAASVNPATLMGT